MGQTILYEKSGYGIEFLLLDENRVYQKTLSIYKLLLVDELILAEEMRLYYSHDELKN